MVNLQTVNVFDMQAALINAADNIINSENKLTEIDTIIGDGDHGVGMKTGFTAVKDMLANQSFDNMEELFSSVGTELLKVMGGASGVIFGTLFIGGRKTFEGKEAINADELIEFFEQSTSDIMRRGRSKPGDKTVLDALIPAIEYMKNERKNTDDIAVILQAAAKGSKVGVEQSKDMYPSIGRSKNFREQAIGYPDPGAVSVSIIIKSFADSVLENNKNKGE